MQSQATGQGKSAAKTPPTLPGINAPLYKKTSSSFLSGLFNNWYETALPITVRERVMLGVMAALKDKKNWEEKVFDPIIVGKWKSEALEASDRMIQSENQDLANSAREDGGSSSDAIDVALDIKGIDAPAKQRAVTEDVFNFCIEELRASAPLSIANGFTEVMDANAAVYISDKAISGDTKTALRSGVASLEDVPEHRKDWHPGSGKKVLNLVHPSLFPLMYGRSRYLLKGNVPLKGCAEYIGRGKRVHALKEPGEDDYKSRLYSLKHQWLPSDVKIRSNGDAKIISYINNLHPDGNEGLYRAIEKVITKSIPLWKMALRSTCFLHDTPRMVLQGDGYDHQAADAALSQKYTRRDEVRARRAKRRRELGSDAEDSDSFDPDYSSEGEEDYKDKYIIAPEPDAYEPRERSATDEEALQFDQSFPGKKLQVIVKLANIQLTPEDPHYGGGSWHVEGLCNEHICASALYYYDSDNITDSHLAFREEVNGSFLAFNSISRHEYGWPSGPDYEQYRYGGIAEIYGLNGNLSTNQVIGEVLTKEDRLLVFPNVLQHRVSPFKLADTSKPGHRKLLALFLVDPDIRIPSTADVPPQQLDWWAQSINKNIEGTHFEKLPGELMDKIYNEVSNSFPISLLRAKNVRRNLMRERRAQQKETNTQWALRDYAFCEH